MRYTYKNIVEAPKSGRFDSFVRDCAWDLGLKIDIEIEESGFIVKRQKVRFCVSDESKEKVESFRKEIIASLEDYEERLSKIRTKA